MVTRLFSRLQFDRPASQNIARPGFYALLTRVGPAAASFVTNVLIGRLASPVVLGQTQAAISTASLASVAGPTSTGSAASKYIATSRGGGSPQHAASVAAFIGRVALVAAVALTVIVAAVLVLTGRDAMTVAVTSLMVLGVSARAFIEGAQFGAQQIERAAAWSTVISVLSTLAVGTMLLLGTRSILVLLPLALLNLMYAVASWPSMRGPLPAGAERRRILHFAGLAMLGTVASTGLLQASVLVAQNALGDHYTGQYSVAITLAAPVSVLAGATSLVLFPILAASHGAGDAASVARTTDSVSRHLLTLMVPALILLVFLGRPVIDLLWGGSFSEAYGLTAFIAAAMVITAVASPAVSSLTTGDNRGMLISAGSALGGAAVGVASWFALLPVAPESAIPIGFLTGTALTAAIPYAVAWRRQRQRWMLQAITTVGAVAVLVIASRFLATADLPLWAEIALAVTVLGAWLLLRRRSVIDLLRAARGIGVR
ncbi:lipopolysaccharide biosynthesis protein [Microbacterium sp. NPDC058342]|uniref:lipopolysaccharide biosynthesis protein n=1 Tax=Microbacterium sp. NPDC058342 TaxID=3346454 RepID=UPI0036645A8F